MLGTTRTVRFAIIGFAGVTLLVLSGLAWGTIASLRLERATLKVVADRRRVQAQTNLRKNLEIARLRMDSQIWPVLIREASRPYWEYAAYYYANEDNRVVEWIESPLRREAREDWIALHFQVTEALRWTSPQLSPPPWRPPDAAGSSTDEDPNGPHHRLAGAVDPTDPGGMGRRNLLERLTQALAPEDFEKQISAAYDTTTNGVGAGIGADQLFEIDEDPRWRQARLARLQQPFLPPLLECEPTRQVLNVTGRPPTDHTGEGDSEAIPVSVHNMTIIWLRLPDGEAPKPALVRRVELGRERAYQGFVVDLDKLASAVAPRVRDLFDTVRLEPALTTADRVEGLPEDPGQRPSAGADEPSTRLGALPVRLVVPRPAIARLPSNALPVRATVTFAWAIAVVALAAIGLGVKRLVTLSERRKEFTYAVTHELRTPLTTFQLYTDMLAAGLVPREKRASYIETLNRESRRLSDLVTGVLEFARVENNAVHAQMSDHPVHDLLDALQERYGSRCRTAGLALAVEVNGTGQRTVHTDLDIALQILGTLIDNACKYASGRTSGQELDRGDGAAVPLRVHVAEAGSKLAIEVRDGGPGIPLQDHHDLFEPFKRGTRATEAKSGGVGLGLALARRWARLIGGTLELVVGTRRRGACFRLTLPAGRS